MRFHGLMVVRDEADVLPQTLEHLLTWIDSLWIFDTGSTDETWQIVNDFAKRDKRVHAIARQPMIFSDNFRSYLFHTARPSFSHGDWVLRVDGDEFYHISPPDFVKTRLRPLETAVHLQWYYFRLTKQEAAAYEADPQSIDRDRQRPISERRRFYKIAPYPEPRMFQYRAAMQWPEWASGPFNAGFVARERLPIRHYPHRDPLQLTRRFRLRASMMKLNAHAGGHWKLDDWRKDLVDEQGQSESQQTGQGLADNSGVDTGPLLYWKPGTELPEVRLYNHTVGLGKRAIQRIIHPLMLPLLDRRRPAFNPSFQPKLIPEDVNDAIGREGLTGVPEPLKGAT